jgi:hypothetical protein
VEKEEYFGEMKLTGRGSVCKLRVRFGIQSSSMVERAAVNRDVVGSSPTSGATSKMLWFARDFPQRLGLLRSDGHSNGHQILWFFTKLSGFRH